MTGPLGLADHPPIAGPTRLGLIPKIPEDAGGLLGGFRIGVRCSISRNNSPPLSELIVPPSKSPTTVRRPSP